MDFFFFISTYYTIEGKREKQWKISPSWALKSLWMVTAAMKWDDCSWKKTYDKSRQVLKSRDITLLTKVCVGKALVFPVAMYGSQIRLSSKELMLSNCGTREDSWESLGLQGDPTSPSYRRLVLDVHWKDWCWSWNSNTLAMWRTDSLEKPLMLGKIGGGRKRQQQKMRWLDGITNWMDVTLSTLKEIVKNKEDLHAAVHGIANSETQFSSWTTSIPFLGISKGTKNRTSKTYMLSHVSAALVPITKI